MIEGLALDPQTLLPHREPMILLDRVASLRPDYLEAEVVIRSDSPFIRGGSIPAWVGIEYMAQACAAFAGIEAHERGEPARCGFLLATRDYRAHVGQFEVGSTLRIRVALVHRDPGGLSVVEGNITLEGSDQPLIEATLTVYEVADLVEFLSKRRENQ